MSGTSYTREPSNGSTVSDRSGVTLGKLMAGAAVVGVESLAFATIGIAKGIGALTKLGMQAYRSEKARKAQQDAKAEALCRAYHEEQNRVEREMAQALQSTGVSAVQPRPAMQQLLAGYHHETRQLAQQIDAAVQQQAEALAAETHSTAFEETMARQYAHQTEALHTRLQTWAEQQAKLRIAVMQTYQAQQTNLQARADCALKDAASLLDALAKECGAAVFASEELALYRNAYRAAAAAHKRGAYAAAFAQAQDILLQAQETMEDVIQQTAAARLETNALLLRAAMLAERMETMKDLRYTLGDTVYAVNLAEYAPEGFAVAEQALQAFFAQLNPDLPRPAAERRQYAQQLRELELSCTSVYRRARLRMEGSHQSLAFAQTVVQALATQGYVMTESAFDAEDALHVNFVQPAAKRRVTAIVAWRNGRPSLRLLNYGRDGESTGDPIQQRTLRKVVAQYTKQELCCEGLGENAADRRPADLERIRMQQLAQQNARHPMPKPLRAPLAGAAAASKGDPV